MRQVPVGVAPPLGMLGSGRVARHLRHHFSHLGLDLRLRTSSAPEPPPRAQDGRLENQPLNVVYDSVVRADELEETPP